ncbi:hypothetical protein ACA910_001887 [Epithemia clementina (nom. ined.)]
MAPSSSSSSSSSNSASVETDEALTSITTTEDPFYNSNNHDNNYSDNADSQNSSGGSTTGTKYGSGGGEEHAVKRGTWTRHLPEAFGIRQSIQASKYRGCVREAGLWAIATGTAMTLHRFRMQSRMTFAIHVGFVTMMAVNLGSYWFCVRRRDYQEKTIEMLMRYNQFLTADQMPPQIPIDDNHPFLKPSEDPDRAIPEAQYVVELPGRKEWQPPLPTQDAAQVFQQEKSEK